MNDAQFGLYRKFPGGKRAVLAFLRAADRGRPSLSAANMWANSLGHIPPKYVIMLTEECRRRRIKVAPEDFVSASIKASP